MGVSPSAVRLAPEHDFAVAGKIRVQLPYGLRFPAHSLRYLRSAPAQGGPQPHALEALISGLRFDLWQQGRQLFGGSVGKRVLGNQSSPPDLLTAYSRCLLNANWYKIVWTVARSTKGRGRARTVARIASKSLSQEGW